MPKKLETFSDIQTSNVTLYREIADKSIDYEHYDQIIRDINDKLPRSAIISEYVQLGTKVHDKTFGNVEETFVSTHACV